MITQAGSIVHKDGDEKVRGFFMTESGRTNPNMDVPKAWAAVKKCLNHVPVIIHGNEQAVKAKEIHDNNQKP